MNESYLINHPAKICSIISNFQFQLAPWCNFQQMGPMFRSRVSTCNYIRFQKCVSECHAISTWRETIPSQDGVRLFVPFTSCGKCIAVLVSVCHIIINQVKSTILWLWLFAISWFNHCCSVPVFLSNNPIQCSTQLNETMVIKVEILEKYDQLEYVLTQLEETNKKPRAGTSPLVAVPFRLDLTEDELESILNWSKTLSWARTSSTGDAMQK